MTHERRTTGETTSLITKIVDRMRSLFKPDTAAMRAEVADRQAEIAYVNELWSSLILRADELISAFPDNGGKEIPLTDGTTLEVTRSQDRKYLQFFHTRPALPTDSQQVVNGTYFISCDYLLAEPDLFATETVKTMTWRVRDCSQLHTRDDFHRWKDMTTDYSLAKPRLGPFGQGWEQDIQNFDAIAKRIISVQALLEQEHS
jgi:hypothetical protein